MKKRKLFGLLFLVASMLIDVVATPVVYGDTYYISSSRGNDGASGTSEQSPWRSLARLRLVSLQPGDVVLLQRGDVWYEDLILDRLHGTPTQPIRIADFGSGNKPLLQPQRASQVLSLSHAHYVHVKNLHLKASSGKKAVRIAGDARFVTVTHCRMEGHPDGNSNHGIVYAAISQGYKPTFPVIEHNEVTFFRESIIGIGGSTKADAWLITTCTLPCLLTAPT